MRKSYHSFKDFFEEGNIEIHREVEAAVHNDENIANNRLFVWHFEEADLEEFLEYFNTYKNSRAGSSSRQILAGNLMRKMNAMMREGYNPVECMLYASKTVNMRLQNDRELQQMLAERIRDVYLKQEAETIAVIENIIKMWAWVPQVKVVITAAGLIGDNQELLDKIMLYYAEDPNYKSKLFHALLQNKTMENLERLLKIVMNLLDTEEDNMLGRVFVKEISGFGYEGTKLAAKYYGNPGISRTGSKVLKKIMLREDAAVLEDRDELYLKKLANKSLKDDLAFKDFKLVCYERYDREAFFLARFSRAEMGDFLKDVLLDTGITDNEREVAVISMGIIGEKGYLPAAALLDRCEKNGETGYAVTVAKIFLGEEKYAAKLADLFSTKKDYELSGLYRVLRNSGIAGMQNHAGLLIQKALRHKYRTLISNGEYNGLECLAGNFQMFWDKKLWALLPADVLDDMRQTLMIYSKNDTDLPSNVVISILETVVHSWDADVEKAVFALYKKADNQRIRELSFRKLKERKIEAPK